MKWLILAALTCNQLVYDQIYEALIDRTIKTGDYTSKADAIELLRKLCHDQPFSLELGKRHINEDR